MTTTSTYTAIVVGLGAQGSGIASQIAGLGHDLVGAVDVGPRVGTRIADAVDGYRGDAVVSGSIAELLDALSARPDIAVVTPAVELPVVLAMAEELLDRGVNVITLNQDALAYDPAWADRLNDRAVAGGASFMGVGIQDIWWVQLVALIASGVAAVTRVELRNTVPLEALSRGVGDEIGIGLAPAEFADHVRATADYPSVIGAPLVEAARRMGLSALSAPVKSVEPVIGTEPYDWAAGQTTLPTGAVHAMHETVSFPTDRGVEFAGVITVAPGAEDAGRNSIRIIGDPVTDVEFGPITMESTNTALLARIPDVIAADPGALFSATMPAPRPQFPVWAFIR